MKKYLVALLTVFTLQVYGQDPSEFSSDRIWFFEQAILNNLTDLELEALLPSEAKKFRISTQGEDDTIEGVGWRETYTTFMEIKDPKKSGFVFLGNEQEYIRDGNLVYTATVGMYLKCGNFLMLKTTEFKSYIFFELIKDDDNRIFKYLCN